MAAQVNLALEGPAAEVAWEGLVAGVLPRVRDEVAALWERLAAHDTLVRLLACSKQSSVLTLFYATTDYNHTLIKNYRAISSDLHAFLQKLYTFIAVSVK